MAQQSSSKSVIFCMYCFMLFELKRIFKTLKEIRGNNVEVKQCGGQRKHPVSDGERHRVRVTEKTNTKHSLVGGTAAQMQMSHLPRALHSALQPGGGFKFLSEVDRETLLSTGSVLGANKGCVWGRHSALHADPKAERKATTPLFKTPSAFTTPSTPTPPSLNTQPPSIPPLIPLKGTYSLLPACAWPRCSLSFSWPLLQCEVREKTAEKVRDGRRETGDQYSKCWTKNLLPAFPLTLESKQSSLLRDTYGPPLLQSPPFSSLLFKSDRACLSFHWLSWLSLGCVIPPSDCTPTLPFPSLCLLHPFSQRVNFLF